MALRLIGVGTTTQGNKAAFAVSDKTTKAAFKRVIAGYKEIDAIVVSDRKDALVIYAGALLQGRKIPRLRRGVPMGHEDSADINPHSLLGISSEQIKDAALASLIENGTAQILLTVSLGSQEIIRDPTLIRAKLKELGAELPKEKRYPGIRGRTSGPNGPFGPLP